MGFLAVAVVAGTLEVVAGNPEVEGDTRLPAGWLADTDHVVDHYAGEADHMHRTAECWEAVVARAKRCVQAQRPESEQRQE